MVMKQCNFSATRLAVSALACLMSLGATAQDPGPVPNPPTAEKPHRPAPLPREQLKRKKIKAPSVKQSRRKPPVPPRQTSVLMKPDVKNLLLAPAPADGSPANKPSNPFGATAGPGSDPSLHWDVGGKLPLPGTDDPALASKYRDSGFHLGLNYHLAPQWDVSGLADVRTGGINTMPTLEKPSVDQVGVAARFKF